MSYLVCKFGGTSVATASALTQIKKILDLDTRRKILVLSAPGLSSGIVTKVTDHLITIAEKTLKNKDVRRDVGAVKKRFITNYTELGLSEEVILEVLSELDVRITQNKEHPEKLRDSIVACGEEFNANLFSQYLNLCDTPAEFVCPQSIGLRVSSVYGDAQPTEEGMKNLEEIAAIADSGKVVVFPGFYGIAEDGSVATFSRGGSDLTGALIAEAIGAIEYENWTDVNGILSANPKVVSDPEQIPALTYKEMRELSYMGFNVFHEEAVKPVTEKKIPIRLRNTNNLSNPGTLIVSDRLPDERDVIGIAAASGFCLFNIQKYLMNREKGFGRRTLQIFEELGLSYEHSPSGVDDLSVVLDQNQLQPGTVNSIIRKIEDELSPDSIRTEFGLSLIVVVGEGLLHKIGVLAAAAQAFADAGININIVNQGSSEISIIFGIDSADEDKAVRVLYDSFFNDDTDDE
ncbi:aspartate kinase [Chitinivibrio alkaliphilus]|uniref:Aspartokinase n=1 Tax=Chitinivibrio alkaliphilus ACht1 TaxID=1313304 RepID=U7D8X7_9BACT|nr:aspartate kinase [Chitinivibrio alkaliphilus]ERP38839.1 aspartokinase III [Chitinivibrio alkaliphilus ACht1]